MLLTALGYFLVGKAALLLAIPPGYASPLYPSAGLALAATLVFGWRVLPGVALGALASNAPLTALRGLTDLSALWLPLVTALGAALQAGIGTALVRWRVRGPLLLGEPREVAAFCLLGGLLACTVNASFATLALSVAGVLPPGARAFTWWTWWGGDTLGVLIGAPITLTLIGRPRADWAARRITLGLPLLVATSLLAIATVLVTRWDTERTQHAFLRDAATVGATLDAELRQALYALEAIHGLFIGSSDVSDDEMSRVSAPWLALPMQLQALGFSKHVARADLTAFEARVARESGRPYRVFDRFAGAAADPNVVATRFIEPMTQNQVALGLNSLSVPAAREAILRSARDDTAAATTGFRLTQERENQAGVVVYRALYRATKGGSMRDPNSGQPPPALRDAALSGVVFVSLRMQQSVAAALRDAPAYLHWCLLEQRAGSALLNRLAGPDGCNTATPAALHHERLIDFAGQRWLLRIDAGLGDVPDAGFANAWLFSSVGLLSAAMLAALLLTVTGRTRRIEAAVDARTQDLQREVVERQRADSALRDSEQRFRNIFDQAPIGIIYTDLAGRVRDANPKLREMISYSADALAQHTLGELTHDDDRRATAHDLARLLQGDLPMVQRRSRLRRGDGQTLWVQMNLSVLRGPDGQPQRLVAVVEDITERRLREDAELGRHQAETANRAKNEFLSRMSHELRTPLNAMLGFAQLLDLDRRPALVPHQVAWVAQVLKAGWHLLEMINDTLDLSRIDAGMMRLSLAPVDLGPLVAHCAAMVEPSAVRRGITLQVQLAADAQHVLGDETRLKQVISNLLSNAVKYNKPGGRVELSTRRAADNRLEVRVLDTGLGLSPAQMTELFQPFNRLGRESSDTEGTGIGLVISRRLTELMGGDLHAECPTGMGQGATFVLTLPATEPATGMAAGEATTESDARYRHRRVHYIEDNETNVEVMRGMLAQRPQVTLAVSTLGLDGLQAVRQQRPDLILLDMHLPDVDGLELLRQLQRDPACADIPVVVVSADATPDRIEEALAAGARHYLTKPLSLAGFLAVLDEQLEAMDTRFG
jgi:PAS domain S-box-containing protein